MTTFSLKCLIMKKFQEYFYLMKKSQTLTLPAKKEQMGFEEEAGQQEENTKFFKLYCALPLTEALLNSFSEYFNNLVEVGRENMNSIDKEVRFKSSSQVLQVSLKGPT